MKRKVLLSLLITTIVTISMSVGAIAATNLQKIEAYLNNSLSVIVNGKALAVTDSLGKPTSPITYNGTTYLPVRSIGNAVGYEVGFDSEENAVLLDGSRTQREILADVIENGGSNLWYVNMEDELYAVVEYNADESEMGTIELILVFDVLLGTEADVFQIDYYENNEITGTMVVDRDQFIYYTENYMELSDEELSLIFNPTGVLIEEFVE